MAQIWAKKNEHCLQVGIYGLSSQSGKAYFADLLEMPDVRVYGYARASENGKATVEAIQAQGGLELQRPPNNIEPTSRFISLGKSQVGHSLEKLLTSDVILFTHPSVYHEETVRILRDGLIAKRIPLILSPSRTLAAPYFWEILGPQHPIISLQTCPYACKSYSPGSSYIKRRKRNWVSAVEGDVSPELLQILQKLYPQIVYSDVPATTSLGNIGAVFHPTPYVMNYEAIQEAASRGEHYSFYIQGIANNPKVGALVGEIDQIRLRIAKAVGCEVLGLDEDPNEQEFLAILQRVEKLENEQKMTLHGRRRARAHLLNPINNKVISAQLWLSYTYGISRIPGESLADAIGRTPNFQERSYPQQRYADEDIPTGLVPLEALAKRLGVPHQPISMVIDRYQEITGNDLRATGRNLEAFDTQYLLRYLRGEVKKGKALRWQRIAS
ncbi:MAG: NAD/NADP octopine/nopaline dehydrogenase family protein [Myxococcales bacterium]|nr:NAD/NADP octopine/nopaline dehydrogenase family protein [Myxococcales bacterium]